jgi:hypothetical protein
VNTPIRRAVAGLFLAPYVALSAAVAPEHVHEADSDHPHVTIHRHVQTHAGATHDFDHSEPCTPHSEPCTLNPEPHVTDHDDPITWLDPVVLPQSGYLLAAPTIAPAAAFARAPLLTEWVLPPEDDGAPSHGPPRACLSLRAPPSSRLI